MIKGFICKLLCLLGVQILVVVNLFAQGNVYEIFALEFAGNWREAASKIAVGATTNDSIKGSSIIWLLKGNSGRMVLVDAGFTDTTKYPAPNYIRPDLTLQKINVKPGD